LTVRETLTYAARFKLPSGTSSTEMKSRVDQVLDDFGLTRVADTVVGNALLRGVSGGEKRRVTLAAQLITFPPIVLLDEPTSGLDSAAAYNVIKLIKKV
jgi:ABC-type multidrug transport system ATPase subunit